MNDPESTDPAWELLKHARIVEPSPYFVRNVLREVRQSKSQPAGILESVRILFGKPSLFAGIAACAALALSLLFLLDHDVTTNTGADNSVVSVFEEQSDAFDPASEMAAVEYLGQLMAVVDPGQLDDDALADLFF